MAWLLQLARLEGASVLAGAQIRYIAPISEAPISAIVCAGTDLSVLQFGQLTKIKCSDNAEGVVTRIYHASF
ncbi:hypothetical protein [Shewanella youngdeokensis]|uniref:Thioesterase domain-containing protein n=1 Tax=Shewanella youngdeokensis TaxID=2999068 RepID=A0ABZ0JZE9_9GAMM|nr:hypothetical protein RGE70_16710 [Shewanella sp. DAU334]